MNSYWAEFGREKRSSRVPPRGPAGGTPQASTKLEAAGAVKMIFGLPGRTLRSRDHSILGLWMENSRRNGLLRSIFYRRAGPMVGNDLKQEAKEDERRPLVKRSSTKSGG